MDGDSEQLKELRLAFVVEQHVLNEDDCLLRIDILYFDVVAAGRFQI